MDKLESFLVCYSTESGLHIYFINSREDLRDYLRRKYVTEDHLILEGVGEYASRRHLADLKKYLFS